MPAGNSAANPFLEDRGDLLQSAPMIRLAPLIALSLLLAACQDETVSGYAGGIWRLTEMAGDPAPEGVTLDLTEQGQISGQAPCNRYSGPQSVPYPWFETGPLAVTRRACAALDAERRYLSLLQSMSLAEVAGDVLILSNESGEELVFARQTLE